jgi:cellulose synthase operon protein C
MRAALPLAVLLLAACSNAGDSAGTPYERGAAALADGDPRTARIELLNAIQAAPDDPKPRLLQAQVYLALKDGVAAEAELARARDLGAPLGQIYHLMAHALLLQGQPQRALAEAQLAPPEHQAYAARIAGRAFADLGDGAQAQAAFEHSLSLEPRNSETLTALARFRRGGGDLAGAMKAADAALAAKPDNVEALTLRGELTRSQYGLAAAIPWFDRALELDPDNVIALLERAATLGEIGRMKAMLADTRRALELSPGNAMAYYLQALLAARAGNFELARSLYERTRGALDDEPGAMLLASAIDYQTGAPERAITTLERLVQMQPNNAKARRLLGAAHWRTGDAQGTVETLRPLADRPDADSYSLSLIGRALQKLGQPGPASGYLARAALPRPRGPGLIGQPVTAEQLDFLRQEAAAAPGHAPAQIALISALLSNGLGREALERARRLQAGNPGAPDAHVLVGDALGILGDFAGAAQEYRKAANLAFTEPTAMRMIEALERSGQSAAAAQTLALFLEQNPRNVPAQLLAASRHMQAGEWRQAAALYESLRERLGDRDAAMLNNLAWAYSELGDYERAVPIARKAWSLAPGNPATADTLGWLLFKSGRHAEGLLLLEQASRGAPTDEDIRRHLSEARSGP